MVLKNSEMIEVEGGASGALINSITRLINSLFNVGQSIGSAIRMATTRSRC